MNIDLSRIWPHHGQADQEATAAQRPANGATRTRSPRSLVAVGLLLVTVRAEVARAHAAQRSRRTLVEVPIGREPASFFSHAHRSARRRGAAGRSHPARCASPTSSWSGSPALCAGNELGRCQRELKCSPDGLPGALRRATDDGDHDGSHRDHAPRHLSGPIDDSPGDRGRPARTALGDAGATGGGVAVGGREALGGTRQWRDR